jgi:hypothetical protein
MPVTGAAIPWPQERPDRAIITATQFLLAAQPAA